MYLNVIEKFFELVHFEEAAKRCLAMHKQNGSNGIC